MCGIIFNDMDRHFNTACEIWKARMLQYKRLLTEEEIFGTAYTVLEEDTSRRNHDISTEAANLQKRLLPLRGEMEDWFDNKDDEEANDEYLNSFFSEMAELFKST